MPSALASAVHSSAQLLGVPPSPPSSCALECNALASALGIPALPSHYRAGMPSALASAVHSSALAGIRRVHGRRSGRRFLHTVHY